MKVTVSRDGVAIGVWERADIKAALATGELQPTDRYFAQGMCSSASAFHPHGCVALTRQRQARYSSPEFRGLLAASDSFCWRCIRFGRWVFSHRQPELPDASADGRRRFPSDCSQQLPSLERADRVRPNNWGRRSDRTRPEDLGDPHLPCLLSVPRLYSAFQMLVVSFYLSASQ